MSNKKYVMCLECGNVQVRTDIQDIIAENYVILSKTDLICVRCMSKKNIATNSIKELGKKIKRKESPTTLDHRVQYLLKNIR